LTYFVHPCPSALSIFLLLFSCPLPLSSVHPPCLISHLHYSGGGDTCLSVFAVSCY
jgi:hypothetical protein